MKLMKILPAALLLSLSLGAYAQDEDELMDDAANEESTEVLVPTTPTDRKAFQRVQLGYMGTITKYSNPIAFPDDPSPDFNNYFLSGVSLGWMGDLRIAKKIGLFLEVGANVAYHTGGSKADRSNVHGDEFYHYKINAFTLSIPVNINKQFKDAFGVKDLTLAPFLGVYARFNLIAKRTAKAYTADGSPSLLPGTTTEKCYTASLMDVDTAEGLADYGESSIYMSGFTRGEKLHKGKLLQAGAQVGCNVYYKRYYAGVAYLHDLTPFSRHYSPAGLTSEPKNVGGFTQSSGTNCDMEISTRHNFSITLGYVF